MWLQNLHLITRYLLLKWRKNYFRQYYFRAILFILDLGLQNWFFIMGSCSATYCSLGYVAVVLHIDHRLVTISVYHWQLFWFEAGGLKKQHPWIKTLTLFLCILKIFLRNRKAFQYRGDFRTQINILSGFT